MKQLKDIPNLSPQAIELLMASGYTDVPSLKQHTLSQLTAEISKTNEILDIFPETPSESLVAEWLKPLDVAAFAPPVEPTATPQEDAIPSSAHIIPPQALLSASFAIPLSQNFIEQNNIDLDALLPGAVKFISTEEALKHMSAEELNVAATPEQAMITAPVQPEPQPEPASTIIDEAPVAERPGQIRREVEDKIFADFDDPSITSPSGSGGLADVVFTERSQDIINKKRILDMETFRNAGSHVRPLVSTSANDLTRSTKKETNAGVSPNSRRFIKGVLHSRAGDFMMSTLAFLLFLTLVISAFVITPLIFIDKDKFWWAMFAPALAFLGLFIYFAFTRRAMCPICNQRQYALKRCLKHRNAHHWGILGYMLPTAIHIVLFKWFRCIFCGTSVRLKE